MGIARFQIKIKHIFSHVNILSNLHQCRLQTNNFEKLFCSQNWPDDLRLSCKGGRKNMANVILLDVDLEKGLEFFFEGVLEEEFDVWCTWSIGELFWFPTSLHFYIKMKNKQGILMLLLFIDVIVVHFVLIHSCF